MIGKEVNFHISLYLQILRTRKLKTSISIILRKNSFYKKWEERLKSLTLMRWKPYKGKWMKNNKVTKRNEIKIYEINNRIYWHVDLYFLRIVEFLSSSNSLKMAMSLFFRKRIFNFQYKVKKKVLKIKKWELFINICTICTFYSSTFKCYCYFF